MGSRPILSNAILSQGKENGSKSLYHGIGPVEHNCRTRAEVDGRKHFSEQNKDESFVKRDCNRLFPQSSALLLFLQPYHSSVYQLLETKTSWTFFFAVPTDAILRRQHRFYSNNVIISSKMFQKPCNSQQKWQLGFYA